MHNKFRAWKIPRLYEDGAPSGGRTHTGRILRPTRETPGFQNLEDLSVAQAQVLGILREVYAFMYAFLIQTVAVSKLHKQLAAAVGARATLVKRLELDGYSFLRTSGKKNLT